MGKNGVLLIGALVALAGYTVAWDGWLFLRGYCGPGCTSGPGFLDLIYPSRAAKLQAWVKQDPSSVCGGAAPTNQTPSTSSPTVPPPGYTAGNQVPGAVGPPNLSGRQ